MLYDKRWDKKIETAPVEPWRQALLDAASLIETRGHCKCALEDGSGRMCLLGAISFAVTGKNNSVNSVTSHAVERVRQIVKAEWVSSWNNAKVRTAEEVVAALREAANS